MIYGLRRWFEDISHTFSSVSAVFGEKRRLRKMTEERERAFQLYEQSAEIKKLHIGAGPHRIEGWFNTDLEPRHSGVYYLDVSSELPFANQTFDYILSEHLIEHLVYDQGLAMLCECRRILKKGGKIRVATPSLDKVMHLRTRLKSDLQKRYIRWHIDHFFPGVHESEDVFVINSAFSGFGHRFLYDAAILAGSLRKSGFTSIAQYEPGESNDEHFRNIENRAGDEMTCFTGLVMEAAKPPDEDIHSAFGGSDKLVFQASLRKDELKNAGGSAVFHLDSVEEKEQTIYINGWAFIDGQDSRLSTVFLVFQSENETYVFDAKRTHRPDVADYYRNGNRSNSGFIAEIDKMFLMQGHYRIGVYIEGPPTAALALSDDATVIIP